MFKKIGFIVTGAVSLLLALAITAMNVGSTEYSEQYGGDAYTGIQNAAAQAANNTKYLADITKQGFAYVLIIVGLALIVVGVNGLIEGAKSNKGIASVSAYRPLNLNGTMQSATPVQQASPVQSATPVQQASPMQSATPVQQASPMQSAAPVQQASPMQSAAWTEQQ